jgi:hypothetical protein
VPNIKKFCSINKLVSKISSIPFIQNIKHLSSYFFVFDTCDFEGDDFYVIYDTFDKL